MNLTLLETPKTDCAALNPNDTEDEEALKTAEVLPHAKQSKLQPSEVDRDHTPDQSTKIPQGSTKDV